MRAVPRTGGPLTNSKGARERIRRPRLDELAELLEETIGKRPRADRLDRDDRALSWCIRKANAEGNPFRTTYTQAAAGMGYPVAQEVDAERRESNFRRFYSSVRSALNSLETAGLIRWGGIKRDNGQWRCLEIEVLEPCTDLRTITARNGPHNGCQLRLHRPVRRRLVAGERRRRHRASAVRRVFFVPSEVANPFGEFPSFHSGNSYEGRYAREGPSPPIGNANGYGSDEHGGAVPPERTRLIEAFEAAYGKPARFSHRRWGEKLDRAVRRLGRYANFGQGADGVEIAIGMIRADAAGEGDPLGLGAEPASLAWWVPVLDATSKDWRRQQKPRIKAARRRRSQERATGARSASPPPAQGRRGG